LNTKVSQGSVATHLRCSGVFSDHYVIIAESAGERVLKISQYLAKSWARVECPAFLTHGVHDKNIDCFVGARFC